MSVINDNNDGQKEQEIADLKAKLAEAESKLGNATNELVEGRKTRAELEGERDGLKLKLDEALKPKTPDGQPSMEEIAKGVLQEEKKKTAAGNLTAAEQAFIQAHKEYSPDNDPGGIKFAAVKAELAGFNLTGYVEKEDFYKAYEKAFMLANPGKQPEKHTVTPYSATPPISGSGPKEGDENNLSSQEKDIVTRLGWTTEKYLEQKAKRPHYVESLLKSMI